MPVPWSCANRPILRAVTVGSLVLAQAACASSGPEPVRSAAAPVAGLPPGLAQIGLDSGDVQGAMGVPTLVHADGAAQYWRYGLGGCQLDLFLYADPGTSPRVAYLDVRPSRGVDPRTRSTCATLASRLSHGAAVVGSAPAEPAVGQPF
jgi:hypothetical protein